MNGVTAEQIKQEKKKYDLFCFLILAFYHQVSPAIHHCNIGNVPE